MFFSGTCVFALICNIFVKMVFLIGLFVSILIYVDVSLRGLLALMPLLLCSY